MYDVAMIQELHTKGYDLLHVILTPILTNKNCKEQMAWHGHASSFCDDEIAIEEGSAATLAHTMYKHHHTQRLV